jgi:hypothetical protein
VTASTLQEPKIVGVASLSLEDLETMSGESNFKLPTNKGLKDLICKPFYLNEYLQLGDPIVADVNEAQFKKRVWDYKICNITNQKDNMDKERSKYVIELAKRRANQGGNFIDADDLNPIVLKELMNDEIIGYDENRHRYFIVHDIFEDWAIEKSIESIYLNRSNLSNFYENIGDSLVWRRAFRSWLTNKLLIDTSKSIKFITQTIAQGEGQKLWANEVLISALSSDNMDGLKECLDRVPLENNGELLKKVLILLRSSCKEIDEYLLDLLFIDPDERFLATPHLMIPKGIGWSYIVNFINENKENLNLDFVELILPILNDWTRQNSKGFTTRNASQIALFYYAKLWSEGSVQLRKLQKNILEVIFDGAFEIKEELASIADQIIDYDQTNPHIDHFEFIKDAMSSSIGTIELAQAIPAKMLELAELYWSEKENQFSSWGSITSYFSLSKFDQDYFTPSALQTPIYALLRAAPSETIEFIIGFVNKATIAYSKSKIGDRDIQKVEVFIETDVAVNQYLSKRLWGVYRGYGRSPYVLQSIHMALERWLLEYVEKSTQEEALSLCMTLLKKTKSTSISAIIVSVALSQPQKLFELVVVLLQTKEFILFENLRSVNELMVGNLFNGSSPDPASEARVHFNDRQRSLTMEHRKNTLENQAHQYQLKCFENEENGQRENRKEILYSIWDDQLSANDGDSEIDEDWKLSISRMDLRKWRTKQVVIDGKKRLELHPELTSEQEKYLQTIELESKENLNSLKIWLWAQKKNGVALNLKHLMIRMIVPLRVSYMI